jgi:hypothetical protein
MASEEPDPADHAFSYDILTGMHEWRLQHPNATLCEIEQALDERWYRVRARMLEDLALQSSTASWNQDADRPNCPDCGRPLIRRGRQPRHLKTHGGHAISLTRTYGYCPKCKKGHFPPR